MEKFEEEALARMTDEGGISPNDCQHELLPISMSVRYESLRSLSQHVKACLWNEPSGNDFCHCERVSNLVRVIAEKEGADVWHCQMVALMHGVCNFSTVHHHKQTRDSVRNFLQDCAVPAKIRNGLIRDAMEVIWNNSKDDEKSLELKCIADADRLDSIGAIGIARCFAAAAASKRSIYSPGDMYILKVKGKKHKENNRSAIWHFYNEILHYKDKMLTATGKRLAKERHNYMENYLQRFFEESEPCL